MSQGLLAAAALAAAFSGFSALGLTMERHHEDSFGRGRAPGTHRPWLRWAGSVGLLVSLAASLALAGPAQGWVLWCGVLTAAALAVVLVFSYAPRRASPLAIACAWMALLCCAAGVR